MGTIAKICGLNTPETVDAALNAGADWIGLVNFAKSPRHVEPEKAAELAGRARGRAKIVSLTVNPDDRDLEPLLTVVRPDIIQLHGSETPDRVRAIKEKSGLLVMKAIGIAGREDLSRIGPYRDVADYILLDAKPPKDALLPGGNGAVFDWSVLDDLPNDLPFMLSGGLTPDNVVEALVDIQPFGVDVSSGVETIPGVKDVQKIKDFVTRVRAASFQMSDTS